jgi:prepilin-type N-terminal cleavage/methylation domain-containing protein
VEASVTRSRARRGFTLIELMVVVAIIGILATAAYSISTSALKNARVDTAMDDLVAQIGSLRAEALTDLNDRLFVLIDAPAGGGSARVFVLSKPTPAWTLSAFDPASPAANLDMTPPNPGEVEDNRTLNAALRLATVTTTAPSPLQTVSFLDATMMGTCGGIRCFALRFRSSGDVRGESPAGGDAVRPGFGFVVTSTLEDVNAKAVKRRAIVVGFPTGVVKSYSP